MKHFNLFFIGITIIIFTTMGFSQNEKFWNQRKEKNHKSSVFYPPVSNIQLYNDGIDTAWTRYYKSNKIDADDLPTHVAIDMSGNCYVTGYVKNAGSEDDVMTLKYDKNGNLEWEAIFDGPGHYSDYAYAIASDREGNVYVTGETYGQANCDLFVIKYNTDGIRQWLATYNGPNNSYDGGSAIVLDTIGNVYVTGYSWNSLNSDYVTVKYNSNGVQQWATRYNGVNSNDGATAIDIDVEGNVYITGYSSNTGTSFDYATIKYTNAGVQQWVSRYNHSSNLDDRPKAIIVNDSGNVFVTGGSLGSTSDYDFATVKINSAGIQQWVARYNSPDNNRDMAYDLALDDSNNVYVTGLSYRSTSYSDYFTIKYSNNGIKQWEMRYNGTGNSDDVAYKIKLDDSSNVYVGGTSYNSGTYYDFTVVKYDRNGNEQWISSYNSPIGYDEYMYAMAMDNSANVTIVGYSTNDNSYDYATVQFSRDGTELWSDIHSGPGLTDDRARGIAVDHQGNVYVTGNSNSSESGYDFVTIKYNSNGDVQWVQRYNDSTNNNDEVTAIAVDDSGNVYIAGTEYNQRKDFVTIKYNTDGIIRWVAKYNGPDNSDDKANAMVIDKEGNVYVTGSSYSNTTRDDFATVKYNQDGVLQWVAIYNGTANTYDAATKIIVDDSGNVYVTGWSNGISTNSDFATVKYNSNGVEQWVVRYDGVEHLMDEPAAIAIDDSGNVCVTGYTFQTGSYNNYATVKYNAAGIEQWSATYNGIGNAEDLAQSIGIDGNGNIYVTGFSRSASSDFNYATLKYDRGGNLQWTRVFNGPGNSDDMAYLLIVDKLDNIYVAGGSYTTGSSYDYLIIKYNAAGDSQWIASCGSPGDVSDEPSAIAMDPTGNIYITGCSAGYDWYAFFTVKYLAEPVAVRERDGIIPTDYSLGQNYPNPFNPATKIKFDIPRVSEVSIKIYNLLGEEIVTLVNGRYESGRYEVEWNAGNYPTGIYICRFNAESYGKSISFIKKLVYIK